jgi:rSAM/selenodomain-associated transferase 1
LAHRGVDLSDAAMGGERVARPSASLGAAPAPASALVAVVVMAKIPGLEPVKSRLHRSLEPAMATLLYRCFLLDRLDDVLGLAGVRPVLACSPPSARAQAAALAPAGYRLVPQRGADLGARMSSVLAGLLAEGHPGAILMGADSPTLPMTHVAEAVRILAENRADLVIGPAEDGGYYLIGLRRPQPALFADMPWSTDRIMELTTARARRLGLRMHVLPEWFDVDTESDLRRLRDELRAGGPVPRRTARCVRAIYG